LALVVSEMALTPEQQVAIQFLVLLLQLAEPLMVRLAVRGPAVALPLQEALAQQGKVMQVELPVAETGAAAAAALAQWVALVPLILAQGVRALPRPYPVLLHTMLEVEEVEVLTEVPTEQAALEVAEPGLFTTAQMG
jgi:hypothetical protein